MRFVTVSGPPSSGKTAIILKTLEHLQAAGRQVGVVKFDCLSTDDDELYRKHGIPVRKGLAGALCPDHYFVSNVEECVQWGLAEGLDVLVSDSTLTVMFSSVLMRRPSSAGSTSRRSRT